MSDEPSPYTEADVERLALALHDADCNWRCQGHGIAQDANDRKYQRAAKAALDALAEAGRLLPEGAEVEWRGLIIDMATGSLVSTWPVLGWPSDEASVRSEAERYADDKRFRVAFERRVVGPWQPITEETDKP